MCVCVCVCACVRACVCGSPEGVGWPHGSCVLRHLPVWSSHICRLGQVPVGVLAEGQRVQSTGFSVEVKVHMEIMMERQRTAGFIQGSIMTRWPSCGPNNFPTLSKY